MATTGQIIRWSTAGAVIGVAAVAAVASYEHAYALVRAHGESGWTAHMVPLTVGGLIYASSMVMLDSARREVPVPALARWLLGLGIAATLAANVAHGLGHGPVGAAVATWPAIALVGSYELFMTIIRGTRQPEGGVPGAEHVSGAVPGADPLRVQAAEVFAADVAAGRVPSVRVIRSRLRVGQPRAAGTRVSGRTRRRVGSAIWHFECAPSVWRWQGTLFRKLQRRTVGLCQNICGQLPGNAWLRRGRRGRASRRKHQQRAGSHRDRVRAAASAPAPNVEGAAVEAVRHAIAMVTSAHASPEDLPGLIGDLAADRARQGLVAYALVSELVMESARELAGMRHISVMAAVNSATADLLANEDEDQTALSRALGTVRNYAEVLDAMRAPETVAGDLDANLGGGHAASYG